MLLLCDLDTVVVEFVSRRALLVRVDFSHLDKIHDQTGIYGRIGE